MNFYKSSLPSTCASLQFLSSVWLRLFHKTQFEKKMDSLQYIFLGFFLQNEILPENFTRINNRTKQLVIHNHTGKH